MYHRNGVRDIATHNVAVKQEYTTLIKHTGKRSPAYDITQPYAPRVTLSRLTRRRVISFTYLIIIGDVDGSADAKALLNRLQELLVAEAGQVKLDPAQVFPQLFRKERRKLQVELLNHRTWLSKQSTVEEARHDCAYLGFDDDCCVHFYACRNIPGALPLSQ